MVTMDEDQAIAHVEERLTERYPDVAPDVVRDAVHDVHDHFDGRVRNYVPILVEREAASRLADLRRRGPDGSRAPRGNLADTGGS